MFFHVLVSVFISFYKNVLIVLIGFSLRRSVMLYSNYDDLKKTIIYTTSMSKASPTTISYPDANIKPAAWFFSHLIPRIDHIDIR